jgi:hypothetical protein
MTEVAPWQVYDQAYYATYAADESADTDPGVSLLIPLDAANRSNGAFRLSLFGGDNDTIRIPAEDVFPETGESIRHLSLNFPFSASKIQFPENSTACHWEDVVTMIRNVNYSYNDTNRSADRKITNYHNPDSFIVIAQSINQGSKETVIPGCLIK